MPRWIRVNLWIRLAGCLGIGGGLWLVGGLTGCRPDASAKTAGSGGLTTLTLSGASTLSPVLTEVARRYENTHPGWRIDVHSGGTSRGLADVRSGQAEIGLVSRALKTDEQDVVPTLFARDGVCLIVHADNPVPSLTAEQVVAIYTGRVTHWSAVGGAEQSIVVVHKADGRSTQEIFTGYFQIATRDVRADVVIGDNEQGIKTVAGQPAAIGYVSIGAAQTSRSLGVPLRLLPLGAIVPTVDGVASGTWPIVRELNLVTRPQPSAEVRAFLEYCRSSAVHDLIRAYAFVPILPASAAPPH